MQQKSEVKCDAKHELQDDGRHRLTLHIVVDVAEEDWQEAKTEFGQETSTDDEVAQQMARFMEKDFQDGGF